MLLLRQRDAGDARRGQLGEILRKTAPAAPDVEHALARLDQKLRRQMAFLGELGIVERLARCLEVAAAILPVGVEEEGIEPAVEIVMMRDVAARP